MEAGRLLEMLMHGNQLKRTTRAGWGQRGVPLPENVAAHSFGVVYTALLLAQLAEQPIDLAAVLAMAALHDLPEGLTTDIPTTAWEFLPVGVKVAAEQRAMDQIVGDTPFGAQLMVWWAELRRNDTAEAQLVHDADKIDLLIQAYVYQQQTGNRQLEEFWVKPYRFHTQQALMVYEELRRRRAALIE